MSQRREIVAALVDTLVARGVVLRNNVFTVLKLLPEIYDFPAISIICPSETRIHYSSGKRIGQIEVQIRAFSYSSEDAVGESEILASLVEDAIDEFAWTSKHLGVYEARVAFLRTDEGLFDPAGVTNITAQITYEVDR
jgi:hypothetical protein